jgi:predicted ATP-dependent serine protease
MSGNVINIFGGPGIGKSTLAAQIYTELKKRHINIEYIPEYPKELVYEERLLTLKDQIYVFAHQHHKIWTAAKHNQVVVTDSPIILSTVYNPETSINFRALILEMHNKFNSMNIVLKRNPETHTMVGRVHSLTESISLDRRIVDVLVEEGIDFAQFDPVNDNLQVLLELIIQEFKL